MEIRKFEVYYPEESEETVFIKDGEKKIVISLSSDDYRCYGSVTIDGEKVINDYAHAVELYHKYGCSTIEPVAKYESDDDDIDAVDAEIEKAEAWLYNKDYEKILEERAAAEEKKKAAEEKARQKATETEKRAEDERMKIQAEVDDICRRYSLNKRKDAHKAVRAKFGGFVRAEMTKSIFTIGGKEGIHEIEYDFMPWLA